MEKTVSQWLQANLSPADIYAAEDVISSSSVLLMQLEIPIETVEIAVEIAGGYETQVILNPAPARAIGDNILKHISILTPNESEVELLTGIKVEDEQGAAEAANALITKGVNTVIITLGSSGAYVAGSDFRGIIPGFSVKAEDTTAAGDVFNGVLAVLLAEGESLPDAVRFSNAAAALSVTRLGAQPSAPKREEIDRFLKDRSG